MESLPASFLEGLLASLYGEPARQLFWRACPADGLAKDFTRHGEAVLGMFRNYWTEHLISIVTKPPESSELSGGSNEILYHISKEHRNAQVRDESITAGKFVVSFVYRMKKPK